MSLIGYLLSITQSSQTNDPEIYLNREILIIRDNFSSISFRTYVFCILITSNILIGSLLPQRGQGEIDVSA